MQLDDYMKLPYAITLRPDEDGDWIAEIEALEGCVAHGETQAEALSRIEEVQRLWIQAGLEHGQPIPTPDDTDSLPSGKWLQRVPRSLHKNLSRLAKVEGTSFNQLVTSILAAHVGAVRGRRQAATFTPGTFIFQGQTAVVQTDLTVELLRAFTSQGGMTWNSARAWNADLGVPPELKEQVR